MKLHAERLSERARAMSSSGTYAARQISFARYGSSRDHVAPRQLFDRDPGFRKNLSTPARRGIDFSASCAGMLGLASSAEQIAEFKRELLCEVCEIPTLPPSIPGLRVFHRMESYLHQIGVSSFAIPCQGSSDSRWLVHRCADCGSGPRDESARLCVVLQRAAILQPLNGAYAGRDQQMSRCLDRRGNGAEPIIAESLPDSGAGTTAMPCAFSQVPRGKSRSVHKGTMRLDTLR